MMENSMRGQNRSVLVTGSAGRLGRAVVAELQRRGHQVRGFDLAPTAGMVDCVVGSVQDRTTLERAMQGIACVIHLAATPDEDDFLHKLLPNNIIGLYHVMEAARAAGVHRMVLASSGQVNWWQQMREDFPIRPEDPVSPKAWYAATKMFLESIGHSFVEMHGMSVIIARLGWCPRTPEQIAEIAASAHFQDIYLSPGDAGRFFGCCVEAPESLRHAIVYATSRPLQQQRFDLSSAETLLGYVPEENWPAGCDAF